VPDAVALGALGAAAELVAGAPVAIAAVGRGSTHTPRSQTRGSLQSVSLLHPTDRDWAPLHPVAATAATAIAPKPALTGGTLAEIQQRQATNGSQGQ
jgi:hypothetical protein